MSHDIFNAKVLSSFLFISPLPRQHRLLLEIFPHFPHFQTLFPPPPHLYTFLTTPPNPLTSTPKPTLAPAPRRTFSRRPLAKPKLLPTFAPAFGNENEPPRRGRKKTPRDSCGSRKNLLTSQLGFRPAKTGKTKTKPKHIDILEVTHTTSRRCGGDAARRARVQKRGPAAMTRQALKEKQKQSHTTKSLILAQDER